MVIFKGFKICVGVDEDIDRIFEEMDIEERE